MRALVQLTVYQPAIGEPKSSPQSQLRYSWVRHWNQTGWLEQRKKAYFTNHISGTTGEQQRPGATWKNNFKAWLCCPSDGITDATWSLSLYFFFTIFNCYLILCVGMHAYVCEYVCVCVCACMWCLHMPQRTSGGKRTTPGHPFSFSFFPPCRCWDSNSTYQEWPWKTWLLLCLIGPQTEFLCCNSEMQLPFLEEISVIWGLQLIQNSPLPLDTIIWITLISLI